ncbi:hypothetical protein Tco_1322090 [Tanacetum coccineum]
MGVVIGIEVPKKSAKGALRKLEGIEILSEAALYESDMKKAVSDEPKDISGSSSSLLSGSDDETKDISSDDEVKANQNKPNKEKADEEMKDVEKDESKKTKEEHVDEEKAKEEKIEEEKADDEQARVDQAQDDQAGIIIPEKQQEKPEVPPTSSSLTLSSAKYGNQFLNVSFDTSLVGILKDPTTEPEIQSMVDVPFHQEDPAIQRTPLVDIVISMVTKMSTPTPPPPPKTTEAQVNPASESDLSSKFEQRFSEIEKKVKVLSKFNQAEAIKESVQANMIIVVKNQLPKLLPKAMSDFVKPRLESTVRDVLQKNPINLFKSLFSSTTLDSFTEYELKNMLYDKMQQIGSVQEHQKHLDLYNALIGSISLDEAIAKGEIDPAKVLKKRRHDEKDEDPPAKFDKEKKRRKRKDYEASKYDQTSSSKKGNTPSKSSKTDKSMNAEEIVEDPV